MIRHTVCCDRCCKSFYVYSDYGAYTIQGTFYECPYCDGFGDIKTRVVLPGSSACELFLDYDYLKGWYQF